MAPASSHQTHLACAFSPRGGGQFLGRAAHHLREQLERMALQHAPDLAAHGVQPLRDRHVHRHGQILALIAPAERFAILLFQRGTPRLQPLLQHGLDAQNAQRGREQAELLAVQRAQRGRIHQGALFQLHIGKFRAFLPVLLAERAQARQKLCAALIAHARAAQLVSRLHQALHLLKRRFHRLAQNAAEHFAQRGRAGVFPRPARAARWKCIR